MLKLWPQLQFKGAAVVELALSIEVSEMVPMGGRGLEEGLSLSEDESSPSEHGHGRSCCR